MNSETHHSSQELAKGELARLQVAYSELQEKYQQLEAKYAVAVEDARLYSEVSQQAKEMALLYEAAQEMTTSLNKHKLLAKLARHLTTILNATSCYISDVDEGLTTLTLLAEYWSPEAAELERVSDLGRSYPLDLYPATLQTLKSQCIHMTHPHSPDLSAQEREQLLKYGIKSTLLIPILFQKRIFGVAEIWESRHARQFTDDEKIRAQTLVQNTAIVLENAQLFAQVRSQAANLKEEIGEQVMELNRINEQLKQEVNERVRVEVVLRQYQFDLEERTELLASINAIADSVYRSFDRMTIATKAVEAIVAHSKYTAVALYILREKEQLLELAAYSGFDREVIKQSLQVGVDDSLTGHAIKAKKVVSSFEIQKDERVFSSVKPLLISRGFHSIVSVPILFQEKVWGAYNIVLKETAVLNDDEAILLLSIGKTIGLAMANAEYVSRIQTEIHEREQVEQALKIYATELERSNRELQDFAYVASHDLQEPLRKIQTFSDRLQDKYQNVLDERGNEYLQRMQKSSAQMRALIEDLLAFSRVTTAAEPFVLLNLTGLVKDVVSDLELQIEQTQGRVFVQPLPEIEAEPVQLRRLFQNLIGNALKFHRPGVPPQVRVWADLTQKSKRKSRICRIYVADNGIGFETKYRDRIFNLFERLHAKQTYEGTGMGLAICRKIVQHHAGVIEAEGHKGEGATFIVTLPLIQDR